MTTNSLVNTPNEGASDNYLREQNLEVRVNDFPTINGSLRLNIRHDEPNQALSAAIYHSI